MRAWYLNDRFGPGYIRVNPNRAASTQVIVALRRRNLNSMILNLPDGDCLTPEAVTVVAEFLQGAVHADLDVAFESDDQGWRIGYVLQRLWPARVDYETPADQPSHAYDLQVAAVAAALKPLARAGCHMGTSSRRRTT